MEPRVPRAADAARDGGTLVVFVRFPEPGAVKTRLAATLGAAGAAALYEAFVRDLSARFRDCGLAVSWAVAPPDRGFAQRFALDPTACFAQEGSDLGERMLAAFRRALASPGARCVLIASDMPHLDEARIRRALEALDHADLVLGPAEDGGYYLIAMKQPHDVFSGIAWSQPTVLDATLARARTLGLSVFLLARDFDVDEASDLERLRALLADPEQGSAMPATSAVLGLER